MMEFVWKYMYLNQKGKNKKLQTELRNSNREIREYRKDLKRAKKKNIELKRALTDATEGFISEWCDNCGAQQTIWWDRQTMGSVAFCPYCGHIMKLCSSCEGECDYNYFTGDCKGLVVYEEVGS